MRCQTLGMEFSYLYLLRPIICVFKSTRVKLPILSVNQDRHIFLNFRNCTYSVPLYVVELGVLGSNYLIFQCELGLTTSCGYRARLRTIDPCDPDLPRTLCLGAQCTLLPFFTFQNYGQKYQKSQQLIIQNVYEKNKGQRKTCLSLQRVVMSYKMGQIDSYVCGMKQDEIRAMDVDDSYN